MDDTGIERANIFGVSEGGSNKPKPKSPWRPDWSS